MNRLTLLLVGVAAWCGAWSQTWDRVLAPGVTFRMEVQADPARTLYGIRVAPGSWGAESHLAKDKVYDETPYKGRDIVSKMVASTGAVAGINGDFFQWGQDPGGDPEGLHVRAGELLSAPASGVNRDHALVWREGRAPAIEQHRWRATARIGDREVAVQGLNQRVGANRTVLFTDASGSLYGDAGPMACVVVKADAPYRLKPKDTLTGRVVAVLPVVTKMPVRYGTFAVAASGERREALLGAKVGETATVEVDVSGSDWSQMDHAMGGGPVLLRSGENVVNAANDPRHPRSAVGVTADGEVWYVVVDGRQTVSVGASLKELADLMKAWGCVEAFNLDGGGSSALHAYGLTLNRPSGGIERYVANGILLYGPPETQPLPEVKLAVPEAVRVGETFAASLVVAGAAYAPDASDVVWACQGAAWVDQTGQVRCLTAGKATLTVWVRGAKVSVEFSVLPAQEFR